MDDVDRKHSTVLIADDNREVNDRVRDAFREHGFKVFQALTGEEALRLFEEHSPEIVFVDSLIPVKNSLDVIVRMRDMSSDVALVFVTGQGMEANAIRALQSGASDYLTKPYDPFSAVHAANRLLKDLEARRETSWQKIRSEAYKNALITITDTMGEAVVAIDSKGTIQFMNSMAMRLWGSLEDMRNKPVDVLIPDPGVDIFTDIQNAYSSGKDHFQNEYTFRKIDGTIFS
ncbi:MAG: response regulator, partial [Desulfomonilia bacterium]